LKKKSQLKLLNFSVWQLLNSTSGKRHWVEFRFNSRILKSNLSWSPTWAKLCQLITSLSMIIRQLTAVC